MGVAGRPELVYLLVGGVRVVLHERNRTLRTGTIRHVVWECKVGRYNFYLEEDGL